MLSFRKFLAEAMEKPRVFYKGHNPGDQRRISTGNSEWDSHHFVSSKKDDAKMYGSHITEYHAHPDAKIAYEGTREFKHLEKGKPKNANMLEWANHVANNAKKAGYHAVHFKRQGDIGTPIFDKSKFIKK